MSSELGIILDNLKDKLNLIDTPLTNQLKDLDKRGVKWFKYDSIKEQMINEGAENKLIYINIGGKIFQTTLLTILNHPDTLLFNLIITNEWNYNEELFIDRSYKYFNVILSYLRNKNVNLTIYKEEEVEEILKEAKFYQIGTLSEVLSSCCKEVSYNGFEFSGEYRSSGILAGTNNIDDINNFEDRSCRRGICTHSPGWILFELNRTVEFDQIELGGYCGNNNYSSSNGSGATIKTSIDKIEWNTFGVVQSNYGSTIINILGTTSKARFVKFDHNTHIGIGYFKIIVK
jgi:hypothetical protein